LPAREARAILASMAEATADSADGARVAVAPGGHFVDIDGLRAAAALFVFFTHVSATRYRVGEPVSGWNGDVRNVMDELTVGVQIFFGISGFVMLRPFVQRHLARKAPVARTGYFARRALRIYPAYWAALLGSVFIVRADVRLHGHWPWFANLLLVQKYSTGAMYDHGFRFVGLPHAWTLSVEVSFYVFLAIYASLLPKLLRTRDVFAAEWLGLGALAVATYALVVWESVGAAPTWVLVLPDAMPYFLCGMALAVLTVQSEQRGALPPAAQTVADHPGVAATVAAAAFFGVAAMRGSTAPPWLPTLLLHTALVLSLLTIAVLPSARPSRLRAWLHSRPAVFLGTVSYGFYLWHYVVVRWVGDHLVTASQGLTMLKVTLFALPASIALAWLSWRLIEQPSMALGRRLTRRIAATGPRSASRLTSAN
jgi:peptidoglycan/LPS O-acetylase OafA/YrhL